MQQTEKQGKKPGSRNQKEKQAAIDLKSRKETRHRQAAERKACCSIFPDRKAGKETRQQKPYDK